MSWACWVRNSAAASSLKMTSISRCSGKYGMAVRKTSPTSPSSRSVAASDWDFMSTASSFAARTAPPVRSAICRSVAIRCKPSPACRAASSIRLAPLVSCGDIGRPAVPRSIRSDRSLSEPRRGMRLPRRWSTERRGGAYVAEQIAACADKLAQAVGVEVTRTRRVMVGVPGVIDPRTGRVSLIPNIAGLQDFDVLGYLRGRFGPDVAIENDVNLAMLGEQALGCARGCHNAAFLALGTGAGLGLLIDDKLFRGAHGAAGEIADLPVARDPTSQIPSATGAFELEVGSRAIVDRYRRQGGTVAVTVRDIFRLLE